MPARLADGPARDPRRRRPGDRRRRAAGHAVDRGRPARATSARVCWRVVREGAVGARRARRCARALGISAAAMRIAVASDHAGIRAQGARRERSPPRATRSSTSAPTPTSRSTTRSTPSPPRGWSPPARPSAASSSAARASASRSSRTRSTASAPSTPTTPPRRRWRAATTTSTSSRCRARGSPRATGRRDRRGVPRDRFEGGRHARRVGQIGEVERR